jgi:6-pyruvoyltetrahydropterin/6-carboxytetrahydropterin synthase
MSNARLTRVVRFSAAHRYHRPDWSEEQNRQAFGACANEHGHGHTYHCAVTVRGTVSSDLGMVIDLAMFDALLQERVFRRLDHQHLNFAVPDFAYGKTIPTAEALAVWVWQQLAPNLPDGVALHNVRIQEDETLFADYLGDEVETPHG